MYLVQALALLYLAATTPPPLRLEGLVRVDCEQDAAGDVECRYMHVECVAGFGCMSLGWVQQ